jgi:hypothetical protein
MIRRNLRENNPYNLSGALLAACFLALPLIQGCTAAGGSVIAATGTTIGVELSQNQTTQTPIGVLGYKRAELAYVPTNRGNADKTTKVTDADKKVTETQEGGLPPMKGGARDSANVLMELRYSGIFDWGAGSGIYQRLAVGDLAVTRPGASMMFAKDTQGKIDASAASALSVAEGNLLEQVSPADWQEAIKAAKARTEERRPKIDIILSKVKDDKDNSLIDSAKLDALVGKAGLDKTDDFVKILLNRKKTGDLRSYLNGQGEVFVDKLLQAAAA